MALINERDVIKRILRHLGLWPEGMPVRPARAPPSEPAKELVCEPVFDQPFPDLSRRSQQAKTDYDTCEVVLA